jgi:hypothetical protein
MGKALIAGWDNYFVIVGSAAAGLTGLTFVVVSLATDARRISLTGLRAFVTPAIVYFCTVLGVAAYLSMPGQNLFGFSIGLSLTAAAGVIYTFIVGLNMANLEGRYVPVPEDWLWHVALPILSYILLGAAAALVWWFPPASLYLVGGLLLALLFIGIHNAWDVAASISLRPADDDAAQRAAKAPEPPADG